MRTTEPAVEPVPCNPEPLLHRFAISFLLVYLKLNSLVYFVESATHWLKHHVWIAAQLLLFMFCVPNKRHLRCHVVDSVVVIKRYVFAIGLLP